MRFVAGAVAIALLAGCNTVPLAVTQFTPSAKSDYASPKFEPTDANPTNLSLLYDHDDVEGRRVWRVLVGGELVGTMNRLGQRLDLSLPQGQHLVRIAYSERAERLGFLGKTIQVTVPGPIRYLRIRLDELATQNNVNPLVIPE